MSYRSHIDGLDVSISHHALERLVQMHVPSWEVHLCLTEPDEVVPSKKYPGTSQYVRRDLTLSVDARKGHMHIITALYSNTAAWKKASTDGRMGESRDFRPGATIPRTRFSR